jgi:anti-sigma B factor antagonist
MKIQTRTEGGCRIVAIQGSADTNASPVLREALVGAIEGGATRVVCDLSQADFICSDSLSVLITAYLKARGRGGFVRLADPQERLRDILTNTRLDRLFEIFPSVDCATKAP